MRLKQGKEYMQFTGKIKLGTRTFRISGVFDSFGFGAMIRVRGGSKKDDVDLVGLQLLKTASGNFSVAGTLQSDQLGNYDFTCGQATVDPSNPSQRDGAYTFVFLCDQNWPSDAPDGDGCGVFGVRTQRNITRVRGVGRLGDGTRFRCSSSIDSDGVCPLAIDQRNQAICAGNLYFNSYPNISDCDGTLTWQRQPNPKSQDFPNGFAVETTCLGSIYTPPAPGDPTIPGVDTSASPNVQVDTVIDGNSTSSDGTLKGRRIVIENKGGRGKVNTRNGAIITTTTDSTTGKKVTSFTVQFQGQNIITGVATARGGGKPGLAGITPVQQNP